MIRDDLIGELSARLERLQAATPTSVRELARGDIDAFARQAPVCADLRMFGACARLIDDC
jgi:hypothetical protein